MLRRLLILLLFAIAAVALYEWLTFPDVSELKRGIPSTTSFMELRKRELRAEGKNDAILYTPVRYEQISPYLRRGVLVAEDNAFYEHGGVDPEAIREAFERDWKRGRISHGGSTITQQLAKNLYLTPSRNPLRKVKEYFIARALEKELTKKRILELYLNVVEMGERVYGAEAASRYYFHKSASALSPSEAALLAGCLPNPRAMVPGDPNRRLRARQKMILGRLRRWGYLFEREVLTERKPETPAAPPSVDTAIEQAPQNDTSNPTSTNTAPPAEPSTSTEAPPAPQTDTAPQTTGTTSTQTQTSTAPPP